MALKFGTMLKALDAARGDNRPMIWVFADVKILDREAFRQQKRQMLFQPSQPRVSRLFQNSEEGIWQWRDFRLSVF